MKECNFLQTYEIFLKIMYISLLKEFYNPNGTLKAKIDRKGNKTEYEYDCMNQLTRESVSGLLEKTYTYDSLGRKVSENDKEKNLREYNYDNLGRVIKEITPEGIELSYTYDARGNVTEYIDGRKTKFVREYTKTDLLKSEKAFDVRENDSYETIETASRSYAYDEGGILKQVTEGSSSIFYNEKDGVYQSDAYGNIRSMKWSSTGLEMNYEYDNLNRMTNVKTPDGKDVVYAYNQNNQVTKFGDVSITYSKSRISEYTLLNGIKKSFEYNDLGVTSSLKYNKNDGDTSISTGFSYTYDDNFNIKTRTSLDTKKLSSFEYDDANRLTNSNMSGEFQSKEPEQLTTNNFSYINRDLVGAKQELVKYEVLPEIIFDTSARSYVYKFSGTKEIRAIEFYPESKVHRVRERDVHIYVKKSNEDAWQEVRNWKFNKDEKNGKLSFVFKEAVSAGYVKVRSIWDDRNVENESIDDYSTFKGNANNLLRIWTLENTLTEEYSYDGNSNRIRLAENGSGFSYEYYKNTKGGNTAKVRFDGKWYYTYDENGNRTSRAKALISGVADPSKEYWTYEWDLWNRLVKVVQYNAPDNGECVDVSYEYDVLNHRISRSSGEQTTKYAYGRNGALAYQEKTVDGSVTKRSFTYLNNEIVGFTDKTNAEEEKVYYTVTDIQGSITEVYDGSSKLVWKSGYTAFGELAGEVVDLIDFDGMHTGCDYDAETGLTYHWNRWRSEDGSSFISEDPARDGMNWYGYAGQNPMVCIDPTGEFAVNILVGAVTGFISSAVINTACQIAFGVMQGQSVTESIKNIDVSSVMISGLGGAVTGAITGGMSSVKAVKDAMTMYKTVNGAVNVAANVAGTTVSTVTNNAINGEKLDKNLGKNIGLSAVAGVVSGALSPGATKAKDGVKESFVKMSTIGKGEKISIIKDVKMDNSIREIVVNVGQELIGNMVE